jgi:tetratricopeptide (TPR) repeat protein
LPEVSLNAPDLQGLPDRFRLEAEIGRGGMSVVYRAYDTQLDRYVAIKVLSEAYTHVVDIERFAREIAVMAKLVHPAIVSLFDSGVAGGRLYYVMPYVTGETLRARLLRERRLTLEDACGFCADVAEALDFAHRSRVVHRDVKPENIFVVAGRAVLADFGIARVADDEADAAESVTSAHQLTTAGFVVGTPAYLSPEQATGSELDGRSDLYSLGCVLYELLTGQPPFSGGAVAVIGQHVAGTPTPLSDHDIRVSDAVADLTARLLAKAPAERPATAGEVASALRAAPHTVSRSQPPGVAADVERLLAQAVHELRSGGAAGAHARSQLEQAEVFLKRVLAIAPRHARALCLYGNWHYIMSRLGYLPADDAQARGRELVLAALAADDQVAEVHGSLAKTALYHDDDCYAAERHARRAVALDPRDPEALRTHSIVLKILGRPEEAVEAAQAAVALEPQMTPFLNALGDALRAAGRHEEAAEVVRRAIALRPTHIPSLERMELALVQLGDLEQAVDFRVSRLRLAGQATRADQLLADAARVGPAAARQNDLRRELDVYLRLAEQGDPFAAHTTSRSVGDRIALVYAELGEWAKAVDWIERAQAHRPGRLRRLLMDVPFDRAGLSSEPRFLRLLRVAGLEDLRNG